jgi:hypothetical protein
MAQDCQSCFAAFTAPVTAGSRFAGKLYCTRNAPAAANQNPDAWLWPKVETDWTCREGADSVTGLSYASQVNSLPGTGGAGPGYLATSTTSLTIASSGSLAAATQLLLAYTPGARVRLTSTGTAAWMEGVVTAYDAAGLLTFTADTASGSGAHTDWDINLAGQPGVSGNVASSGSFTCGATRPIVVSDAAVTVASIVLLVAANAAAASCVAGQTVTTAKGIFHVTAANVAGVSFSVDSGDSTSFAGTETFEYIIVN